SRVSCPRLSSARWMPSAARMTSISASKSFSDCPGSTGIWFLKTSIFIAELCRFWHSFVRETCDLFNHGGIVVAANTRLADKACIGRNAAVWVDFQDIRLVVAHAQIHPRIVTAARQRVGFERHCADLLRQFLVDNGRAIGIRVMILKGVLVPFRGVRNDLLVRVADRAKVNLGQWQDLRWMITPDGDVDVGPLDELLRQSAVIDFF